MHNEARRPVRRDSCWTQERNISSSPVSSASLKRIKERVERDDRRREGRRVKPK
jgi:hypothetical protein